MKCARSIAGEYWASRRGSATASPSTRAAGSGGAALLVVIEAGAHEMSVLKGPARAVRHSECLKCKKHCYRQGNTSQKRFHGLVSFYSGCNNRRNSHSAL